MNIKGRFVTLRAIEREDLELMREMLNDPEIESLDVGWAFPVSKYQQEQWYEKSINDKNNFRFIIETEMDGAIGIATLINIDWKNRRAEHGIKLANREKRTKGIGMDVVMAIMKYAFDELQLNRLDGSWFDDNTASKKLYQKCGWKVEGRIRSCVYKNGKYKDLDVVGILRDEYYELVNNNYYWGKEFE